MEHRAQLFHCSGNKTKAKEEEKCFLKDWGPISKGLFTKEGLEPQVNDWYLPRLAGLTRLLKLKGL